MFSYQSGSTFLLSGPILSRSSLCTAMQAGILLIFLLEEGGLPVCPSAGGSGIGDLVRQTHCCSGKIDMLLSVI